ncbi:DUF4231 domain-containing protein, partial [Streptococcus pneumoniae]
MTPEEMYLTERLDVQIAHFLKKSVQHRRRYKVLKITEIVAGFLIAVFCAIPMPGDRYRLISVALSSLGLLCEGIINLYNAKENWISYQKTAQLLEKEKFLYQCQTEKYAGKTKAFALFVKTCEGLISEEINQWESIQSKEVA